MHRFIKSLLKLIALFIGLALIFLLYLTFTQYNPKDIEDIEIKNNIAQQNPIPDTLNFLSWNIGYAGLGAEMDFFYEGGKLVRPTHKLHQKYIQGIVETLDSLSSKDFIFIQEVDEDSHRSYFTDEVEEITDQLAGFNYAYAVNYKVAFVPAPIWNPMGQVKGGLMTLSKYAPDTALRIAFPQILPWPKSLGFLNRCFIETRYHLDNGKDLVMLNTHNSFYNNDSIKRYQELNVLKFKMLEEYKKGNYVVAGGDWNQTPIGFAPENYPKVKNYIYTSVNLFHGYFPPKWNIAFDGNTSSARFNDIPYVKDQSNVSLIDFFVLSPNVEVLNIKTLDLGFKFSDHNPVQIQLHLQQ